MQSTTLQKPGDKVPDGKVVSLVYTTINSCK